jgi:hypothetical protein
MSRAYGADATLLGKTEIVYGTAPAGNWEQLPFISSDLGSLQPLVGDPVLGYGRDPIAPFRDVIGLDGNIVVPADARDLGFWLHKLLGAATVTGGADPFTHTFKSGEAIADIPSFSLQIGYPAVPAFHVQRGLIANTAAFNFTRSGGAQVTIGIIGQQETRFVATQGGVPTPRTYAPFNQFQGAIKKGGATLANITEASLSFSNNAEAVQTIRADGLAEGVDPTVASCTGSMTARYAETTLLADAEAGTEVDLELSYTISATRKLLLTVNHALLSKPKVPVPGPGGISATFEWQAYQNPVTPLEMLTVALINDIAAYT